MLVLLGQGGFYLVTTLANTKDTVLTMKDLMTREDLKANDTFQVVGGHYKYGVVKPGTLTYDHKVGAYRFSLTDFERETSVIYRGELAFESREGESIIINGYFPDVFDRSRMICTDFVVNHSLEAQNWESRLRLASKKRHQARELRPEEADRHVRLLHPVITLGPLLSNR